MPWIRHAQWFEDGLPAHTVTIGLEQFSFWDRDRGDTFIPHRETARKLLNRYPELEIAWERYGVQFASDGTEVTVEATGATPLRRTTGSRPPETSAPTTDGPSRGRTRKA